jgi:DNA-binding NarL/FixJ family response regulator
MLMDVRMPELDGLAATRAIAREESLAGVRIVILTTFKLDEYVFEALKAGASGFLVKDTEPEDLVRAVALDRLGRRTVVPALPAVLAHRDRGRPGAAPPDRTVTVQGGPPSGRCRL